MDSRNSTLSAVAFVTVVLAWTSFVFAGPVYIYSGDFDLPIPADPEQTKGWMDDAVIEVADHFTIYDLDVGISLTHTNVFDLQIRLQSPGGTTVYLNYYNIYEFFEGQNYTQTIFDDEAETPIEQGQAPFTGRFRPRAGNFLTDFDGEDTYGLWRLQIYDAFWWNTGTFNRFELIVTTPEPATVILLALGATLICLHNRPKPGS